MKTILLGAVALLAFAGCSGGSGSGIGGSGSISGDGEIAGDTSDGHDEGAATPSAGAGESSDSSGAASPSAPAGSGGSSSTGSGQGSIAPGTLTAGVWDDNRNFDTFLGFRDQAFGANQPGLPSFSAAEQSAAHDLAAAAAGPKQTLDVQIVIDTTGSMGDEIAYLDTEFDAIVSTIQAKFPAAQQRWSLVAYKDKHDEYVARWFDFRSDPSELHAKLQTLSAGGGGDFPESPEVALGVASQLSWRTDAADAKIIFWVADAPHHAEDEPAMTAAIRNARDRGIHVYPVAASGIDDFTEYTMRSAAQITGGRYVFLTDDSGVGESHEVPEVPCFFVTKLNQAILRVIDIEMSGQYREPTTDEIIRTGGDPANGACRAADGTTTTIY